MKSQRNKIMIIMLIVMVIVGWYGIAPPHAVKAKESGTENMVINKSNETIKLTIEHYENGKMFYKTDSFTLTSGEAVVGYNKAKNFDVESVILDNQQVDDPKNIIIQDSGNHIMKVNYQPTTENSVLQDVHFYDYTMIPNDGSPGINDLSNYEAGAQFDHIEGKRDKTKVYGNVFTVGLTTSQGDPLKAASRFSGFYDSNGKPVFMNQGSAMATQGIVKSLSGENYSQVNFRDGIYAPKLFNNDPSLHVNGMTNIDNYKLRFEHHGDTYTLKEALKPDGSHAGNVDIKTKQPTEAYTGDSNFYPLDDYSDEIPDSKINLSTTYSKQLADGSREYHNMLFGMRFDVKFSVDQYSDLSQLRFNFSGDDDMWAFIDAS